MRRSECVKVLHKKVVKESYDDEPEFFVCLAFPDGSSEWVKVSMESFDRLWTTEEHKNWSKRLTEDLARKKKVFLGNKEGDDE